MSSDADAFLSAFRGGFSGVLRWPQLDDLWAAVRDRANQGWYIYSVGNTPPQGPAPAGELERFVREIDHLLRTEHAEDYCGIVYADSLSEPGFIKIYDPGNLGMVCGSSDHPPLPGWILSTIPPVDLQVVDAANRKRWWRRLVNA